MRTLIIIVNWRTGDLTINCLKSLAPQVDDRTRVIVSDNASGDGSADQIERAIHRHVWDWASVLRLARNGGFAFGNNEAIRRRNAEVLSARDEVGVDRSWSVVHPAAFEYCLVLNPDTIVREGAVRALTEFMDSHPFVGIAGSRLEDPDGTPQRSAFRFHGIASEFERAMRLGIVSRWLSSKVVAPPAPQRAGPSDWLAGASMIVRREVFERVGLLDEQFFMYFEEVDFCRRARDAGFEIWYVPQSRVVHLVGAASQVSDARKHRGRRPDYWFESRRRYYLKHLGAWKAALADLAFVIGFSCWRVRRILQRKPDPDPPMFLWDFLRHSVLLRGPRR